jgi:aldehyde:ferredoxin oxidoreductase
MAGGYTGKILRLNLTNKSISVIDTEPYEEYGGGHGIGSAVFWDLVGNQLPFSALDPRNVITIMTSPFSGVVVPSAAGRCEVQGIGPQSYPVEWFTRSNFGGRFSSQLKYAGWDGIAIEGGISARLKTPAPYGGWIRSKLRRKYGVG